MDTDQETEVRSQKSRSVKRLVLLARELKRITGEYPNVTIKQARAMAPAELEEQLRAFGSWYRFHAEENAQRVEQAIWAALDDEENRSNDTSIRVHQCPSVVEEQ